ncbi:MAG TPA: 1,4-alpha-glucan branching protein domain-containing protein [Nitrospirales bacterium]
MTSPKPTGYLCLVLHCHLPYVRHPEHERFLEENWLYEAITDTYIPLLRVMNGLVRDGADFRLTVTLSPPLISMLRDPLLISRYERHVNRLIELAAKEVHRTAHQPEFHRLATMYLERFLHTRQAFTQEYGRDLVSAFVRLQNMGKLEIITCGATHGFLPLLNVVPSAVRAQLRTAVAHYEETFGRPPHGIWLPECGYYPGLDELLRDVGLQFFFTESHGLLYADPRPRYGVHAPVFCPTGVAAFARDLESSKQVWSAEEGYPGDPVYRDYYRDIGWDLDYDYMRPYIQTDGKRGNTGIKYHRITGKTDQKQVYNRDWAIALAADHAGNFMFNRERQVEWLSPGMDRPPIVVAPYDAELFGHWWFEGPEWLDFLFRKLHYDQHIVKPVTPAEYLERHNINQMCTPSGSSWGHKGYHEVWLNGGNDWIYRHLHHAAQRMEELARRFPRADGLTQRALAQAGRELLLAQSSDWAFIMKTGTMVEYAVKRTRDHLARFTRLYEQLLSKRLDAAWLKDIEEKDNIFPNLDYRNFS